MKIFLGLAIAFLCLPAEMARAAQTAEARMYCLSIRFNRGAGPFGVYSLDLTGIDAGINGELFPVFGGSRSHHSFISLNDETFEPVPGQMDLNVPAEDANGDGFPDVFDVSQSFTGGSSGAYSFPGFANGNVAATWSRSAGSPAGTCQLNFGSLGTFNHTFNIFEYKGPLSYTPGTNLVSGSVNLKLTGVPDFELKGPIAFAKSAANPHNELTRQSGSWTNTVGQTFPFFSDFLDRDLTRPTNYYGYLEFVDWDLSTSESDYYLWVLSIDDLNDIDTDTIPDFSDDPQNVSPRRPLLALKRSENNLLLTITGDVGQVCQIQEAATVSATNWPTIFSLTLTNDPHTVSLPLPPSGIAFWRARVP